MLRLQIQHACILSKVKIFGMCAGSSDQMSPRSLSASARRVLEWDDRLIAGNTLRGSRRINAGLQFQAPLRSPRFFLGDLMMIMIIIIIGLFLFLCPIIMLYLEQSRINDIERSAAGIEGRILLMASSW